MSIPPQARIGSAIFFVYLICINAGCAWFSIIDRVDG